MISDLCWRAGCCQRDGCGPHRQHARLANHVSDPAMGANREGVDLVERCRDVVIAMNQQELVGSDEHQLVPSERVELAVVIDDQADLAHQLCEWRPKRPLARRREPAHRERGARGVHRRAAVTDERHRLVHTVAHSLEELISSSAAGNQPDTGGNEVQARRIATVEARDSLIDLKSGASQVTQQFIG